MSGGGVGGWGGFYIAAFTAVMDARMTSITILFLTAFSGRPRHYIVK